MPSNVKLLAGASGGEPTDTNFKNVTLLLHGDGSNGAQNNTFLDSSTNNFTITRNGNTTQGSFSPYGSNWSNYFDGTGDYLTVPANTAFAFGTGDFTVEFWFSAASYRTSGSFYDCFLALGNFANSPYFRINQDGRLTAGITATNEYYTTSTVTLNRWTHFAVTRQGSTVRLFVNGVLETTQTNSTNLLNTTDVTVGTSAWQAANETFTGYLSNVRVVKGTAVYTSTFTPSTTPLTAITNTSLLTCAYNRFRDASTNNFTITRNGDVKVTNFAPFAPSAAYSTTTNGGSAYFDGTGDWLDAPNNAAFGFGTGDYTVEFWLYLNTLPPSSKYTIVDFRPTESATPHTIYVASSGYLGFYNGSADVTSSSAPMTASTWTHIAYSRSSGTLRIYVNGVQAYSAANTVDYQSSRPCRVGAGIGGIEGVPGYISNFRVVKGTAVYTSAFTPPTSPVTAITNTSLLLNATNAAIFDNSMKNDLETVGNAQISTSVKKFGTGSMAFDGSTSNRIRPPASDLYAFGTGNFTVEAWVYVTNLSTENFVFDTRSSASTAGMGFSLQPSTGKLRYSGNANNVLTTTGVSANTWTHVAWVRNGSTITGYINGVSGGSASNSDNLTQTNGEVGNVPFSSVGTNMYIDDLRITKGVARYTANFTAPTAPFPNK